MILQLFALPVHWLEHEGYLALFIWSITEGEIGLMLTGWLISIHKVFTFEHAYLVAISGAFIGDNAVFLFGRLFEKRALRWLARKPGRKEKFIAWFRRWGAWLIVFERFIYGTHIPALLTIGMSGYSYWKFLVFDILGILLWAATFLSIGYYFGQSAIDLILLIQKNIFAVLFFLFLFTLFLYSQKDET